MSHAAYMLRDAVSATLFTIVGILCKVGWQGGGMLFSIIDIFS